MLDIGDLVDRVASDLADTFGDAVHAVQIGLTQLTAVRVDGQAATELDVAVADEVLGLTPAAEAELLELIEHIGGEVVVDHGGLDVCRRQSRGLPQLSGDGVHLAQHGEIVVVVRRHHLLTRTRTLGCGPDDGGRARKVACTLQRSDDEGLASVGLLAAVEQVERLDDPPRGLMLLQGDRLLVEPRLRVGGGVLAVRHRHPAEVLGGGAGDVQVALGGHGHPLRRGEQALGRVPGEVRGLGVGGREPTLHADTEPVARSLVERPIADDHVGHSGLDGHGCLLDGAASGPAAVVDAAEEGELPHAQAAGDLDFGIGVRAEGHQTVHLGRLDPGIAQGEVDGLHGQSQLAAARLLGELGGADSGDGGLAYEGVLGAAHWAPPTGRSRRTVPVTWSPRPLAPRRVTSTAALPSTAAVGSSLAVTDPVRVMVSSG